MAADDGYVRAWGSAGRFDAIDADPSHPPSGFGSTNLEHRHFHEMRLTALLADAAQAVNGKLYVLGGGWSVYALGAPIAIAIKIEVPWTEANQRHRLKIALFTEDEQPVELGGQVVEIGGDFEVGRPPGIPHGIDLDIPLAFNLPPLPLQAGLTFVWRCWIDDKTNEDWRLTFHVPAPPAQAPRVT